MSKVPIRTNKYRLRMDTMGRLKGDLVQISDYEDCPPQSEWLPAWFHEMYELLTEPEEIFYENNYLKTETVT